MKELNARMEMLKKRAAGGRRAAGGGERLGAGERLVAGERLGAGLHPHRTSIHR